MSYIDVQKTDTEFELNITTDSCVDDNVLLLQIPMTFCYASSHNLNIFSPIH